jgi:hypothetical protein
MSKPLSILSAEQLGRLKFIKGTYLLVRGVRKIQTVHKLDTDYYMKLETFLSGKAPLSVLKEGMKVFIIPDGSISGANMAAVCKKLNLKITTDLTKAHVLIGNDNLETKTVQYSDHFPTVKMTRAAYMYFVPAGNHQRKHILNYLTGTIKMTHAELPEITEDSTILMARRTIDEHYPSGINTFDSDSALLVSDHLMNIVYHALDRKLLVVNDSELFESLEKVALTEETYATIESMYSSDDPSDWDLANQLLFNCDYEKSKFYIWQAWDNFSGRIQRAKRTKMYENFYNSCFSYLGDHVDDFVIKAATENILPEKFYNEYMKQEVSGAIDKIMNYNRFLTYDIRPKYTYQEFINIHQDARTEESIY